MLANVFAPLSSLTAPQKQRPYKYYTLCGSAMQGDCLVKSNTERMISPMHDILKRWYEGNLSPLDEIYAGSPEYNAIQARLEYRYHRFFASLTPEQQTQLTQMTEDMYSLVAKENYIHFAYGFRLGASLLCEIF